jgi:hypothetical protein
VVVFFSGNLLLSSPLLPLFPFGGGGGEKKWPQDTDERRENEG